MAMITSTFMPSHLETARRGRSARKVRRARNAPMLDKPAPSAAKLTNEICKRAPGNWFSKNKVGVDVCGFLTHQASSARVRHRSCQPSCVTRNCKLYSTLAILLWWHHFMPDTWRTSTRQNADGGNKRQRYGEEQNRK